MLITVENLDREIMGRKLLKDVSFTIEEGEGVGFIGANGEGKSTLLNIIAGKDRFYTGSVKLKNGISYSYLTQEISLNGENTVREELENIDELNIDKKNELERYCDLLEETDTSSKRYSEIARKYSELMNEFHDEDTGSSEGIARNILIEDFGLDASMLDKKIKTLSGGERRKVELANFFSNYKDVDLFIMDEPTNHLDLEAKKYFEKFLNDFKGSYLMVEHDRELLENTVEKILELKNAEVEVFFGKYSEFEKKKETRTENKKMKLDRLEQKVKREKEAIKNLKLKAGGGNDYVNKERVRRFKGLKKERDKLIYELRAKKVDINLNLKYTPEEYTLIDVKDLTKSYDEIIFEDICFDMKPGKKIALVGPNGSGKTTLMDIIAGKKDADSGEVVVGKKTKIGYHSQEFIPASEDYKVLDDIWDKTYGDHIPIEDTTNHLPKDKEEKLRNHLGSFGFIGDDVFKDIRDLSGGEKTLLSVAEMMFGGCNLILLDEPTNNLDIEKREKLEGSLQNYKGGVLLASHDRRFIKNALDETWSIEGDKIERYVLEDVH